MDLNNLYYIHLYAVISGYAEGFFVITLPNMNRFGQNLGIYVRDDSGLAREKKLGKISLLVLTNSAERYFVFGFMKAAILFTT